MSEESSSVQGEVYRLQKQSKVSKLVNLKIDAEGG
jgi:hypothetical protein